MISALLLLLMNHSLRRYEHGTQLDFDSGNDRARPLCVTMFKKVRKLNERWKIQWHLQIILAIPKDCLAG